MCHWKGRLWPSQEEEGAHGGVQEKCLPTAGGPQLAGHGNGQSPTSDGDASTVIQQKKIKKEKHIFLSKVLEFLSKDPSSLQASPALHSVPAKPPVSTGAFRKVKKTNVPQSQQSDAGTVVPKQSSQPDTPCTPAAVPKIDVSADKMCQQCNISQHLYTTWNKSNSRHLRIVINFQGLICWRLNIQWCQKKTVFSL